MDWIESLALGVVQGLTEFLPISSDGHLNITERGFQALTGQSKSIEDEIFFIVMLHVGTLLAILLNYRTQIAAGARGLLGASDVAEPYQRPSVIRTGILAVIATLPLIPDKLYFMKIIEGAFKNLVFTGVGFLITAAVLLLTIKLKGGEKGPAQTSWWDALLVGIAQMFAPLPGVSRSGLTIAAALALGFSRTWAVNFSLMMAVPAIVGATVFELRKLDPSTLSGIRVAQIVASSALAGVIGYLAILWLLRLVRSGRIWYFSVYLVLLGTAVIVVALTRGTSKDVGPSKTLDRPYGSAIRDRLIDRSSPEAANLWLLPSTIARDQVVQGLSRRSSATSPPRVWTWDDAWRAVARGHPRPPARLSEVGRITVLGEAIERSHRAGLLDAIDRAVEGPGYRRQLLEQFSRWTTDERRLDRESPRDAPESLEEWSVFGVYRSILREIEAEDAEGFAVWASMALRKQAPPELSKIGQVVVIDPIEPTLAGWRLLETCHTRSRSMTVVLPFDADPALEEAYAAVRPTRQRFLDWGFEEIGEPPETGLAFRPPGLGFVENELFRLDVMTRPRLRQASGLRILGGPRGEGVGLMIASEVRSHLENGIGPDDILVVVPRLDENSDRIRDVMASWGLPVAASRTGSLANLPAVSVLRLAARLPVDRWEISGLIRLLRNNLVSWGGVETPFSGSEAASAIRATRVFRDRSTLRNALRDEPDRPGAKLALEIVDRLSGWIDPIARPGAWSAQVGRLIRLADSLGLPALEIEPLWDALEDRGWVLEQLGPAVSEESLTWADFVHLFESLLSVTSGSDPVAEPGTIRFVSVAEAAGVRVRVMVLANLSERTFPSPGSVDLADDATHPASLAYSREILSFIRAAGSAEDGLILASPRTDLNGEELLPSGFLDDLIRRLDREADHPCVAIQSRFDPVLVGHESLARSPGDARVLAVANACREGLVEPLARIAGLPEHSDSLIGTAHAFEVASHRRESRGFGPYDGLLRDPLAIARIGQAFGPTHAFSASQLESFALCPFQFYQRYVLGLKPVDDREELGEDYAGRGSLIHDVLEQIHRQVAAEGASDPIDRLGILIETGMQVELQHYEDAEADVSAVLREIGTRRTNKTLGRYLGQFRSYVGRKDETAEPHQFEVLFGQPDRDHSLPHLSIGEAGATVLLQGKIDRIDLVKNRGKVRFRVIDYKTGSCPPAKDVQNGLASQLPLYALAAEQLILADGEVSLIDVGYWSLPKEGYKSVKIGDWEAYRGRLMAFILEVVARLRSGSFPIDSMKKDCRKFCDFQSTCRVAEVRRSGKVWPDRPSLEAGE